MALSDIVGVNAAACKSKHLHGTIQARMTTLMPAKAGDNMGIAKEKDERIKSRKVPQRKVGETFGFLESVVETQPSTEEQDIVFDYTRFAEVEAYGLKTGKTRLNDGGLFIGTRGQFLTFSYDSSAPAPISRAYGEYRVFFYKDERWGSGRVQTCELGTGRTASCMLSVKVYMVENDDKLLKPVAEPYMEGNFRAIHSAYHGTGIRDAGSNVRWFLHKEAPAALRVTVPAERSAAPPAPTATQPTPAPTAATSRPASTTSRTDEHGLSYVLKHALPEQGVVSLEDAWHKFLGQRAVIRFNGIAIFHDYTTDPDRSKKTNKRLDSAKYSKNRIVKDKQAALISGDEASEVADNYDVEEQAPDLLDDGGSEGDDDGDDESVSEIEEGEEGGEDADGVDGMGSDVTDSGVEAGNGELGGSYTSFDEGARTGGIMQAIVDTVTACQLLPPLRFHMYSNSVASTSYGRLSWPGLSWSQVNSFRLMRFPDFTVGRAADIPVSACLKNLSMAAVLGRLPTCASGCVLLTLQEVKLVLERCDGRAYKDSPEATWTPLPRAKLRDTLPLPLSALIVCKAADVGVYESTYTATSINGINCSTLYLFHTAKYLNASADKKHLTYYFKSLHGQQEQSAHVRDNTKMEKGRLISADDGSHVYDEMINANGKTTADLDDLSSILQQQAVWGTAKGKPPSGTEAAHLTQVPWVLELAQHLLDDHANLYDCFNLETLAHLIAYMETPVRQQDVWDNRASLVYAKVINYVVIEDGVKVKKVGIRLFLTIDDPTNKKTAGRTKGRAGHLNDPLPTSIPLPPGLTRMYLAVLFVCRTMRMLWQQQFTSCADALVPDRIIGLAGNSNKLLGAKTFTEVIRKLGMCHFGIPKWGPYSIRNTFVTEIFKEAYSAEGSFGRGAAQELLAGRMNDTPVSTPPSPTTTRGDSGSAMDGDDINADVGGSSDSLRQGDGGYGGGGDAFSVARVAMEAIQNMQRMLAARHWQAHQAWLAQQQTQQVMYYHMMQNFSHGGFPQLQPPVRALSRNVLPTASVQNAPSFYFTWPGYGFNPPKP
ncbi:hypothetical protein JKP88DRAFT_281763 [Tribonema minus]|uniref:Uncharacterized protein n=1 Tax=Tribonema minus TaxID=303371 RepID=A0A835YLN4_9STRA|nr:hypothetical protein JKP88DRAFT_281763 [Tribonema minus]